jgi:hypothetical protein
LPSTVALVTAVLAVMLVAFALPQLHLHPHKIPIAVAGLAPATKVIGAPLGADQPGAFDVTAVPDAGTAREHPRPRGLRRDRGRDIGTVRAHGERGKPGSRPAHEEPR